MKGSACARRHTTTKLSLLTHSDNYMKTVWSSDGGKPDNYETRVLLHKYAVHVTRVHYQIWQFCGCETDEYMNNEHIISYTRHMSSLTVMISGVIRVHDVVLLLLPDWNAWFQPISLQWRTVSPVQLMHSNGFHPLNATTCLCNYTLRPFGHKSIQIRPILNTDNTII